MSTEQPFKAGDIVESTDGYCLRLTKGKRYTVTKYEPACRMDNGFTYPEYVTVIGDFGDPVTGHTYRFRKVEDN